MIHDNIDASILEGEKDWFGGLSTIVGYLMQNTVYTYTLNIYDLVTFLNKPDLIFPPTMTWFQVLLSNTNNSICY